MDEALSSGPQHLREQAFGSEVGQQFGIRIRTERLVFGWTQAELAEALETKAREISGREIQIRQKHVSRWELGHLPRKEMREALCLVLNLRLRFAMFGEGSKHPYFQGELD